MISLNKIKRILIAGTAAVLLPISPSCRNTNSGPETVFSIRPLRDTIGFAQYTWQMDSIIARMKPGGWRSVEGPSWKAVICPHDDYTYVGTLYPDLLQNIKAKNLILIGVAHKAAQLKIEDSLVFDSYTVWKGPWRDITVSTAREEIYGHLSKKYAIINDSLHTIEHSVEAMVPYLQYFNRDISIIPVLVPAMSPERLKECGLALGEAIKSVAASRGWLFGKDYAIVITSDAVHYGNQDWGGIDRAYFGCDDNGNQLARNHEKQIIDSCFTGRITEEKLKLFSNYTLSHDNFRDYKWTWCGRYSIPVGLYASIYLDQPGQLSGFVTGYSTSITSGHIPVDDLGMGRTAIATNCHWVGYAAIGFRSVD